MKQVVAWMLGMGCAMWAGCADDDPGSLPGPSPETPSLTRVEVEAPGAHCALGGTAVHSGLDINRNGTLDANEVVHTDYVCAASGNELWNGDFVAADWMDPAKVEALQHVRVVLGSLTIAAPGTVALPVLELVRDDLALASGTAALPALAKVGASLKIDNGTLSAPSLREVGSDVIDSGLDTGELALPSLLNIGRDLQITGNVTALHAEQLVAVGRDMKFSSTTPLAVVLPALASLGHGVESNTGQLTRLELPVLDRVPGQLSVFGAAVTTISLPQAYELGALLVGGSALTTLDLGVHFVDGVFYLTDAPALTALALPSLLSVGDHFIVQATGITDLVVPNLSFVRSCVLAPANPALRTLSFPSVTDLRCVSIYDSPPLTSVSMPSVETLETLAIANTPEVRSIDFASLREVGPWLSITGTALADLSGLRALTDVGRLNLEQNSALRDLSGLSAIRRADALELIENPALTSLTGLERVTQISNFLVIRNNHALTSARGLQNVTHMGSLELDRDPALPALAFPHLLSIDGALKITGMSSLISLAGFDALRSIGGEIAINDNAALPAAAVDAFLARFPR